VGGTFCLAAGFKGVTRLHAPNPLSGDRFQKDRKRALAYRGGFLLPPKKVVSGLYEVAMPIRGKQDGIVALLRGYSLTEVASVVSSPPPRSEQVGQISASSCRGAGTRMRSFEFPILFDSRNSIAPTRRL